METFATAFAWGLGVSCGASIWIAAVVAMRATIANKAKDSRAAILEYYRQSVELLAARNAIDQDIAGHLSDISKNTKAKT